MPGGKVELKIDQDPTWSPRFPYIHWSHCALETPTVLRKRDPREIDYPDGVFERLRQLPKTPDDED